MEIAYTAHTEACTYLLDAEGICRSVLAASSGPGGGRGRPVRIPSSAERCIGAQYVASLDLREAGALVALPKPGSQLLFARTEANGRITLVRTGTLLRFEQTAQPVATESGVHARPDDEDDYLDESAQTLKRQTPSDGRPMYSPSYGDDEELTTPFSPPTIPFRRDMLPPIARASSLPPPPPADHPRISGIVPAGHAARATIPPPPPTMRTPVPSYASPPSYAPPSYAPGPYAPRRPSLVRVSAPFWDAATQPPRKRSAR